MSKLKEMYEERMRLVTEARALVDRAESEKRSLNDEEQANYDRIMGDVGKVKARIERLEALEGEERALSQLDSEPQYNGAPGQEQRGQQDPLATPEYRAAYDTFLRTTHASHNMEARATLQVSSNQGGGYRVPQEMAVGILQELDNTLWMRQLSTPLRLNGSDSLGVVTLDADPSDGDWTPEVGEVTNDTAMALGKRELKPNLVSKLLKVSQRLARVLPTFPTFVQSRVAYKLGVTMEQAYMTGDGVNKPLGVFVASANGIPGTPTYDISTGNDQTNVTFDGLMNAKFALPAQYRRSPSFRFLGHRDLFLRVAKLKDGEGRYIWQPSVVAAEPDRILGVPIVESEYAPNTFTSGQYVGVFGDFQYYQIVDSLEITIQSLFEKYATTNQIGYIARAESDGQPVLPAAFRRVKLA